MVHAENLSLLQSPGGLLLVKEETVTKLLLPGRFKQQKPVVPCRALFFYYGGVAEGIGENSSHFA